MEANKGFPFFEEIGIVITYLYYFYKNRHIKGSMMYNRGFSDVLSYDVSILQ
jgi:hypothetical protein